MKRAKHLLAFALAAIMAFVMATPAFAAGGSITIENPASGETYTAYKIFNAAINATDTTKVSYTISNTDAAWDVVVGEATADANGVYTANGLTFTPIASNLTTYTVAATDSYDEVAFAAMLSNNKSSLGTGKTDTNGVISVTEDGYYFVDTTLGSLCSLYTNNTAQKIYEKNSIPTLEKKVKEDTTEEWGTTATADMGQTVDFKLTVNTGSNTNANEDATPYNGVDANYVITDKLPVGMTYMNNAAIEDWTAGTDFTAVCSGDTLTITLMAAKVATLGQNANIVITYGARVDTDAVVGSTGNVNSATLAYQKQTTTAATATVKTYKFEVLKVDASDQTPLKGVKFTLTGSDNKYYIASTNNSSVWQAAENEIATGTNGKITFTGLDAGTYTLTETETLNGYNELSGKVTVVIAENGTVTMTGAKEVNDGVITIENKTGAILPSTGGMGTTLIYAVGAILVLGSAVGFVARRKMNA